MLEDNNDEAVPEDVVLVVDDEAGHEDVVLQRPSSRDGSSCVCRQPRRRGQATGSCPSRKWCPACASSWHLHMSAVQTTKIVCRLQALHANAFLPGIANARV